MGDRVGLGSYRQSPVSATEPQVKLIHYPAAYARDAKR
jgi:hypothetical protein